MLYGWIGKAEMYRLLGCRMFQRVSRFIGSSFPPGLRPRHESGGAGGEWSEEEVADLRMAHMCVNPTRTDFWEEVAKQVGKKTALECHAKWFKQFDSASPKRGAQTNQQTQSDRKRTRAAMSASNAR